MKKEEVCIFWFRRDLRLNDNSGLYHALKNNKVLPIYIFENNDSEENEDSKRLHFIKNAIASLNIELQKQNSSLSIFHGNPLDQFKSLIETYNIKAVYANHEYEPTTITRDKHVSDLLSSRSIPFLTFKDHVIFEKKEITKSDGLPYTVFTPFMKTWKNKLSETVLQNYPSEVHLNNLYKSNNSSEYFGIEYENTSLSLPKIDEKIIMHYDNTRNFPSIKGTTRLSAHIRYGTVSVRELVKKAIQLNEIWLNELIWREFYMMILFNFPHVEKGSFKKKYDSIKWINNENDFEKWCKGETGYPIVDAGMRELNATGFMHNRVRMIVASFLVKHLLIDWRWGEAYFASKLIDYDLSANNGGWQWASSSGCDAVPYFRIFNPYEQTKRFDTELKYIHKWVLDLNELSYPKPIVEHAFARLRALDVYKKGIALG